MTRWNDGYPYRFGDDETVGFETFKAMVAWLEDYTGETPKRFDQEQISISTLHGLPLSEDVAWAYLSYTQSYYFMFRSLELATMFRLRWASPQHKG